MDYTNLREAAEGIAKGSRVESPVDRLVAALVLDYLAANRFLDAENLASRLVSRRAISD